MSFANSFTKIKAKAYDLYGKDPAKMLLHTGAWGWILSSLAQVTGVVINDKISPDEKKFLIPQEIADAAINIISFYTVTRGATALGEKLVTSGKLITKPVRNFVVKAMETAENKVKLGEFSTNIEDIVKNDVDVKKAYYGFKTGVKVIASTTGAVVSSNVLTPYVRNHIGADAQKRGIKPVQQQAKTSASPVYGRLGIEDYKKQALTHITSQPSSMKI